ncbi:MAG: glycosyltransferase family 4 protein [Synechococcales bacterium]|nr:glycosyltransferase family 4 protein [Synechococcales bacterium]
MRITIFEKEPSSQRGGQERSLLDVARQLQQKGHQITLIYTNSGDFLAEYEQFCDRLLPLHSFSLSPQRGISQFVTIPQDIQRSLRCLREQSTQVLYINQIYDAPLAGLLAKLTGLPLVCHLRLPAPETLDIQRHWGMRSITHYIAVSQHVQQQWQARNWVAENIDVVYNGLDLTRFVLGDWQALRQKWGLPLDQPVLAYVGRLDRRKGIDVLLKSFAQVRSQYPMAQLLIAGKPLLDGDQSLQELETLVQQLDLHASIRFLGHIHDPRPLYQLSDLTIVPSVWAEPCGRVVLESMACGTPVVATQVGGNPELLRGEFAAGLVPARDVDQLAQKIGTFLNWRDRDPSLGNRARQHVQQSFRLDQKANKVEAILQQICQPHSVQIQSPESPAGDRMMT